ncbi:hypothetical protein PG995_006545 [Apiospora arundinis]
MVRSQDGVLDDARHLVEQVSNYMSFGEDTDLAKKNTSSCNYAWPTVLVPLATAQDCHDYLANNISDKNCTVPPPPPQPETPNGPVPLAFGSRVLCQTYTYTEHGHKLTEAIVLGATFQPEGATSACRDVAKGVQWILDKCTRDGQVAGQAPAWGNGDLLVVVQQGTYLNLTAPT